MWEDTKIHLHFPLSEHSDADDCLNTYSWKYPFVLHEKRFTDDTSTQGTRASAMILTLFSWDILAQYSTHWGQVTHISVSKLTIIGSDNGLSAGRRQANIWTNDGLLPTGALGTYFSEILIKIQIFWLKKTHLNICCLKNVNHLVSASMC